ncbi:MAG: N-acetylneuraminate synthase [Alphaproteobacteria bacterium]|nr:N-acetylneuraminate synthase [Alphaproteobacteria bacterium]
MATIEIGGCAVGPGQPVFIAAEIGINHNGDMDLARRMIDAAAAAGADAVKFQNYRTEDFVTDRSLTHEYENGGHLVRESQYKMFKRYELRRDSLRMLSGHCRERGVIFFSTPSGEEGIDDLLAVGTPLLKNGSDYLTNLPLIRAMARTGLPTVLSTGMATVEEIRDAVEAFRGAGNDRLILLLCTSTYPAPDEDVNLRRIPALAANFATLAGFSDHSFGITAAIGAVAMGACFVEKHFTLDKNLPGPDHRFSSDPAEFAQLVRGVRAIERQLGSDRIGPAPSEIEGRAGFRLSCVAARDLPAGHVLRQQDVAFRRPGTGLPPKAVDQVLGRKLAAAVAGGHIFGAADFHG